MVHSVLEEFGHFATTVLAYALALSVVILLLLARRRVGWKLPIEPTGFLDGLIEPAHRASDQFVNVEFRDSVGEIIDFGPFVKVTLRNGRGGSFELHEGVFVHCHPDCIKAGTVVAITLQDGLVKETLTVQLDLDKQTLFVQSHFTRRELLEQINHIVRKE